MVNAEQKNLEYRIELSLEQMPMGLPLMTFGSTVERIEKNRFRVGRETAWTIGSAVRMIASRRGRLV